ncbi:MAG: nucleoside-diphosphate sugar epimerase/dehydratase [Desulfurivibrio sp.]|nr:nucleoside-diphosphate sugar epimerase/dehydratase [Desulfurivibrio sp.]
MIGLTPWIAVTKRLLMVLADLVALPLALWSGFALRLSDWWPIETMAPFWGLFIITPVVGVVVFARLGLYRAVVRFMGSQALLAVVKGAVLLGLMMLAGMYFYGLQGFPRSVAINFSLVTLIYVGGTRVLVRSYYHWLLKHHVAKEPVLIYGSGSSGAQLAAALVKGREFYPAAFVDDDPGLWNSIVQGVNIYAPERLPEILRSHRISRVLLAIPNASKRQRKQVLDRFAELAVRVQTVPSMPEIVSGEASVDQLREIELEDLLGRDPVPTRPELLAASVEGKVVLVTGAGGSIGSELCRQIAALRPAALVLFEASEFALYAIDQELRQWQREREADFPIYAILGTVCHRGRVEAALRCYRVQTIYHAAAYKHVPLVEYNVCEGIRNNVFGSKVVAEAALALGVERCVLISTDKAVRPTNVMGASKRLAELILQGLAQSSPATIFSMVRFGNVLGSSGSVVPLFRRQIETGGPLTVTHPEITRYFMTISEAASLVIQAGSMARGGDVFVLDMGDSVKIADLARRMVQLSGLEVKDERHPQGDIEITFTGLRPGEKLYEELLIGANVTGTGHPKIMRAHEESLTSRQLEECLAGLRQAEAAGDCRQCREILEQAVQGFAPAGPLVDYLERESATGAPFTVVAGGCV